MGKQAKNRTPLSIVQIQVDTDTDDKTIEEFLSENNDPGYKFPYSDEQVEKMGSNNTKPL